MKWAEYWLNPYKVHEIEQCGRCQSGDFDVTCLRDNPFNEGRCPCADDAPELFPSNEVAAAIFRRAEYTAERVEGKDKTVLYLRSSDVEALMNLHDVPKEDRLSTADKVHFLAGQANSLRRARPRKGPFVPGR